LIRPWRDLTFTSPFTIEEAIARLRERDDQPSASLRAILAKQIGVRFTIEQIDPLTARFTGFKQRLSIIPPFPNPKSGGVVLNGRLTQREDGKTFIAVVSSINVEHFLISGSSLLLFTALVSICVPLMLIISYQIAVPVAVLVELLVAMGGLYLWSLLLNRIHDDLVNILKWTLHGYGLQTHR
jgi:hypothetical protein